jgi:tRNA dimethylallyltransferase
MVPTPAIFLTGPTASGKTALALSLAQRFPVELVSVDSAQVYRGLNVGTAKPDATTLQRCPHHLIDIVDPTETYSAARFVADARAATAAIHARNRVPLLVGGTMLYAKALFDGLSAMPPANAAIREQLEAEGRWRGWPALHAELLRVDPATAARLAPNDRQRIQRALEVFRLTGQPISDFQQRAAGTLNSFSPVWVTGLMPVERTRLHAQIETRFHAMLDAGLVDETRALRDHFALTAELPSMRSVGYRQAWQYLDGEITREQLVAQGVAATRQLAKRQMTWMRSMREGEWFDPFDPRTPDVLLSRVERFFARLAELNRRDT